jgi:hypothetical protein
VKKRELTGGKERWKWRDSEAKKVGERERGKVGAKNYDSGGNPPFHQRSSLASQKNWSCWPNLVDLFQ